MMLASTFSGVKFGTFIPLAIYGSAGATHLPEMASR